MEWNIIHGLSGRIIGRYVVNEYIGHSAALIAASFCPSATTSMERKNLSVCPMQMVLFIEVKVAMVHDLRRIRSTEYGVAKWVRAALAPQKWPTRLAE